MKSVNRRHPELAPVSPHKLRHTGATLAKKSRRSLEEISEVLTHSDQSITKPISIRQIQLHKRQVKLPIET